MIMNDSAGDSLCVCVCVCVHEALDIYLSAVTRMHASVCLPAPVLSVSISVGLTTVLPVFNFINSPSSSGCKSLG